jgi:3',5'-cyclic AMP phosphodiesterase CpdA
MDATWKAEPIKIFGHILIRLEKDPRHTIYPSDRLANERNRHVIKKTIRLAPDLVIHLGDVVHSIPTLPAHEIAVQIAQNMCRCLEGKLYVVPGNHDVGNKPNAWVPAPALDEKSCETFGKYWNNGYFSFDHQDCRFILINSSILNSGFPLEKE